MRANLSDAATVGVCVQLDHAVDVDLITAAVESGADPVLVDGSRRNPRGNADFVAAVRSELTPRYPHLVVEAELGRIEGNEDVAAPAIPAGLTDPTQVPDFLDRSGTDLLAVSIGNVHRRCAAPLRLDFARLADILARTDTPLVLHGASGLTQPNSPGPSSSAPASRPSRASPAPPAPPTSAPQEWTHEDDCAR